MELLPGIFYAHYRCLCPLDLREQNGYTTEAVQDVLYHSLLSPESDDSIGQRNVSQVITYNDCVRRISS